MVKLCALPAIRCVAIPAIIGGLRMGRRLANRFGSVVAACAGARYTRVVKMRHHPVAGGMACVAFGAGYDMVF